MGVPFESAAVPYTYLHSGPADGDSSTAYSKYLMERCVDMLSFAGKNRSLGNIGVDKAELYTLGIDDRGMESGRPVSDQGVSVIVLMDKWGSL